MAASVLLGPIVGCGGNADLEGVYGSVTIDGQPLADAMVTVVPAEGDKPAAGCTDKHGKSKLIFLIVSA